MHVLLAHAYHVALVPIHFAFLPVWRPLIVALAVALCVRFAGGRPYLAAGGAALAGWTVQNLAWIAVWPVPQAGRLPGLALIVVGESVLRTGGRGWLLPVSAALAAWWLRGAPLTGPGFINCMPVFLGFLGGLPLARRLTRGDAGWGSVGAALALAGGLLVTGASAHWVRAALVPGVVALALLGVRDAAPTLAGLIVVMSASTIVASDRGRLAPIDAACLAPLLVWVLVPRIAPRVAQSGPAVAGLLAAALCIGLAWAAKESLLF